MRIQEAATQLGMTTRAIRFYEQKGLLSPQKNEQNGYRTFSETDLKRLRTIGSLRELDLTMEQIRSCIEDVEAGRIAELRPLLNAKRQEFAQQYAELKRLLRMLEHFNELEQQHEQIDSYRNEPTAIVSEIHRLGEQSRRYQQLRDNWQDRWHFNTQAQQYDEAVFWDTDALQVHANYDDILDRVCAEASPKQRERGLDLGIGTGNLSGRFVEAGASMTGVDQSEAMLERCQQKWPHIRLLQGNFLKLPLLDETFDFIVSTYALHHLTDDQKLIAFEEMNRLLLAGGRIVIADLMFENEEHRRTFIDHLQQNGNEAGIAAVHDEFFADRSRLVQWLHQNGYDVYVEQLNHLVHLIHAVKL
ncbi:MerR family transcriptional regulator [Paenibacillus sp. 481]|uniref:MerR family transcriptional regulator n=1 Tax=Paenibacillus sp. 481 TaxID=2835869 RepID=UPI001E4AE25D|nr:MerR family transcriptional regulator [Paenibacillus sp. 481]UHA71857.1 methyltransferase domain-containing protein [Paenibacillus sp. 481]